ncbi:hypothetical protein AB0M54_45835 [Actinoplanes sp. NPDC051470]|uniref:hypothetical protein n=1 Tax=Actinoplanes sp. NPDC051470 TaxID=3157224 RepID=UPI003440D72F
MRRIVVLSDLQIPYHDKKAVAAFLRFLTAYQPDELASVGDEVDFPQISRWNRGMEGEYRGDLQTHVNAGVMFFEQVRNVYSGPVRVMRSNHMDRPLRYVRQYAPGLLGLKALTVPSLLEFERLNVIYHEQPYELAPGWLLAHGDEAGGSTPVPGGVAMRLARKWGKSVVCGHTHKFGMQHDHSTVNGKVTRPLFGMEVGNFMDFKAAHYLKAGSANWQQGFGILYVDGKTVTPTLVPIAGGKFVVEGRQYQ